MTISVENLVVGAGPSGLAVGACLQARGLGATLLDKASAVGWTWRNHYERLHLHTCKKHSSLPYLPFPDDYPTYPSRRQVVDYLEAYARTLNTAPQLGVTVQNAAPVGDRWLVKTDAGDYQTRRLIMASGYNRVPHVPSWPDDERFGGERLHSSEYGSGRAFAGKRVLVVGSGNSGAEIAIDLWECGARPWMCIRGPVHVTQRDPFGIPAQVHGLAMAKLPVAVADKLALMVLKYTVGDLSRWGIVRPEIGPVAGVIELGRVPLIDVGTVALIKQGAIGVVPGIERFHEDSITFVNGDQLPFDAVVTATGYRAGLSDFLEGADDLVNDRGYPREHGAQVRPGLFFVGYSNPPTGFLREIGLEAQRVADAIAREV